MMRVGVALPVYGPHASAPFIREVVLACEELGYDSVWVSDHMTWSRENAAARLPGHVDPADVHDPHHFEPVSTLSYAAGLTSRVRLGTAIMVLPVRNPVVLAKQVACLDELSSGRVVLGVGVGGTAYAEADFAAVGESDRKSRRGRATDEWIEVMRCVWDHDSCDYTGKTIEVKGASIFPKPRQPGGPPILIGGDSDTALQRVARLADGSVVSRLAPGQVAERREQLAKLAEPFGRADVHFHLMVSQWLSIDDDAATATDRAQEVLGGVTRGGRPIAGAMPRLIGAPGQLRDMMGGYLDSGMDEMMVQVAATSEEGFVEAIRKFRHDVLDPIGVRPVAESTS